MEQISQTEKGGSILLKEKASYPEGHCCLTRLLLLREEGHHGFLVEVVKDGERAVVSVGADPEIAVAFFSLVAGGMVTPISLTEIWEDFCYLQKIEKNSLLFEKVMI